MSQHNRVKISVLIPTYNHGKYLRRCLESVISQSYKASEIVVIDDGSTDDTRSVIQEFEKIARYIYQPNSGCGSARNTGMKIARNEWIAFVDADDVWHENKLYAQVKVVCEYPDIDILVTNSRWLQQDGSIHIPNYFSRHPELNLIPHKKYGSLVIFTEPLFKYFIKNNFINNSSVLIKKQCLIHCGGYDEMNLRNEDRELWLRLAENYNFALIDEILTTSYVHSLDDGPTSEKTLCSKVYTFKQTLKRNNYFVEQYKDELKEQLGLNYFELGYFYFRKGNLHKAKVNFMNSFLYWNQRSKAIYYLIISFMPYKLIQFLKILKSNVKCRFIGD